MMFEASHYATGIIRPERCYGRGVTLEFPLTPSSLRLYWAPWVCALELPAKQSIRCPSPYST